MSETKLQDRRFCETWNDKHHGIPFTVSYGRDEHGNIKEVFIDASKIGSALEVIMNDIAIILSKSLRSGLSPSELFRSTRRDQNGRPASMLGIILRDMVKANKDIPDDVRETG